MTGNYSEQQGGYDDREGGSVFDAAETMGIHVLGIRRLPAAGEEMAVSGELWQIEDVAEAVAGAENRLPDNVREKLTRMSALGLGVDYLIAGSYAGRADDGSDQRWALEPNFFGFRRARPMLNVGLMYEFGGPATETEA